MKELISFMFMAGMLLFLFGAMVLGNNLMWIGVVFCFVIMIYFATLEPQTQDQRSYKTS